MRASAACHAGVTLHACRRRLPYGSMHAGRPQLAETSAAEVWWGGGAHSSALRLWSAQPRPARISSASCS